MSLDSGSGSLTDLLFRTTADFTALASFTSEASLLGGTNLQPKFRAGFFDDFKNRSFGIRARGIVSSTGTPTYTFTARLGSTAAAITGTVIGISAAIVTGSGVSNKWWELEMDWTIRTHGIGSGNATLAGSGRVKSPGGFASPFEYAMAPNAPDSTTWTATLDSAVQNYLQLSATCSASSSSNTITCKELLCFAWN